MAPAGATCPRGMLSGCSLPGSASWRLCRIAVVDSARCGLLGRHALLDRFGTFAIVFSCREADGRPADAAGIDGIGDRQASKCAGSDQRRRPLSPYHPGCALRSVCSHCRCPAALVGRAGWLMRRLAGLLWRIPGEDSPSKSAKSARLCRGSL